MTKYYRIADLIVKMDSFGTTENQAEMYKIESREAYDIEVVSNWEKIKEAHNYNGGNDDMIEYLLTGGSFYKSLLDFSGFMLHSSCIVVDGKAYLFSADSGTGKSTHTQLWLKKFGARAFILNDDKPALRYVDGKWYAYGTPWSGKHDISRNVRAEVQGIAMIERSETNSIEPFSGVEAIAAMLRQCNRPKGQEYREKLLSLFAKLFGEVKIWKLKCNMNEDAADVSYMAMSGNKN